MKSLLETRGRDYFTNCLISLQPLMKRFQNALKKQLSSQHEKVRLELSELTEALKRKMSERENIGVELYGVQQELARYAS